MAGSLSLGFGPEVVVLSFFVNAIFIYSLCFPVLDVRGSVWRRWRRCTFAPDKVLGIEEVQVCIYVGGNDCMFGVVGN